MDTRELDQQKTASARRRQTARAAPETTPIDSDSDESAERPRKRVIFHRRCRHRHRRSRLSGACRG